MYPLLRTMQRARKSFGLPPKLANCHSAGTNLEIFKFGLYIMFPIGWMYYFGTNLDNRFQVPDFWPKPEETHKLPYDREEQIALRDRLRDIRLEKRRKRLEAEGHAAEAPSPILTDMQRHLHPTSLEDREDGTKSLQDPPAVTSFGPGAIENWARAR